MGCNQKKLYRTHSVVVTSSPVRVNTQRPLLVPSFTEARQRTFHTLLFEKIVASTVLQQCLVLCFFQLGLSC